MNNTLLKDLTEEETNKLRTPKRLIQFVCEQLGITHSCNIAKILDIRNRFSAHARLKEIKLSNKDKNNCKILAAKIIIYYSEYLQKSEKN
jgi:hypothetical protein